MCRWCKRLLARLEVTSLSERTDRCADRQAGEWMNRRIGRADEQVCGWTNERADAQTGRRVRRLNGRTDRQIDEWDEWTYRWTDGLTDKQVNEWDKWTYRWMDGQTGRRLRRTDLQIDERADRQTGRWVRWNNLQMDGRVGGQLTHPSDGCWRLAFLRQIKPWSPLLLTFLSETQVEVHRCSHQVDFGSLVV